LKAAHAFYLGSFWLVAVASAAVVVDDDNGAAPVPAHKNAPAAVAPKPAGPERDDKAPPPKVAVKQSCYQQFKRYVDEIKHGEITQIHSSNAVQGCYEDSVCAYQVLLDAAADKWSISKKIVYATAWTETKWKHWDPDKGYPTTYVGRGVDFGIMQVNQIHKSELRQASFARNTDTRVSWDILRKDPLFNILYAVERPIVKNCMVPIFAEGGDMRNPTLEQARSVYSCYNGGPGDRYRWKRKTGNTIKTDKGEVINESIDLRDNNFFKNYMDEPWEAALEAEGCV
jgi:hypothetical protein